MRRHFEPGLHRLVAVAGKRGLSTACLHRWRSKGVGGLRLPCVKIGGRWYVDGDDFQEFVEALTAGAEPNPSERRPTRSEGDAERAGQLLDARIFARKRRG